MKILCISGMPDDVYPNGLRLAAYPDNWTDEAILAHSAREFEADEHHESGLIAKLADDGHEVEVWIDQVSDPDPEPCPTCTGENEPDTYEARDQADTPNGLTCPTCGKVAEVAG